MVASRASRVFSFSADFASQVEHMYNTMFFFRVTNVDKCDSHGREQGVKSLLPQDLPGDRMLDHPRLELGQLQHIVLVLVPLLEHLRHHLCQVQIVLLFVSNLNEDRHQLVQLVQCDHLVSVLVEEVEDSCEVVLHLAGAEQVEENEHVGHGNLSVGVGQLIGEDLNFFNWSGWEGDVEHLDEHLPVHLAIGIFVHAHVKVLFHQLASDKPSELGEVVEVPGLDPLPSLCVAHLDLLSCRSESSNKSLV